MKRLLIIGVATLAAFGCSQIRELTSKRNHNAYESPFYAKYLNTGSSLDAQIQHDLDLLRQDPSSAEVHNDLGTLLVQKGFPRDAEREFERAINANGKYYPAWYNLGLIRAARGDELGAARAFRKTVDLKPGHPAALFQLGLVEEKREHLDRAVALYAKAYAINPALLDVEVNPRILDSKLTHLALLKLYGPQHTRTSMQFQGASSPGAYAPRMPAAQEAPSPQPQPQNIVPPAAPVTDPSQRPAAQAAPPAQTVPRTNATPQDQQQPRRRRPTNPLALQPPGEKPPKNN